jgi:hypothetical protein
MGDGYDMAMEAAELHMFEYVNPDPNLDLDLDRDCNQDFINIMPTVNSKIIYHQEDTLIDLSSIDVNVDEPKEAIMDNNKSYSSDQEKTLEILKSMAAMLAKNGKLSDKQKAIIDINVEGGSIAFIKEFRPSFYTPLFTINDIKEE